MSPTDKQALIRRTAAEIGDLTARKNEAYGQSLGPEPKLDRPARALLSEEPLILGGVAPVTQGHQVAQGVCQLAVWEQPVRHDVMHAQAASESFAAGPVVEAAECAAAAIPGDCAPTLTRPVVAASAISQGSDVAGVARPPLVLDLTLRRAVPRCRPPRSPAMAGPVPELLPTRGACSLHAALPVRAPGRVATGAAAECLPAVLQANRAGGVDGAALGTRPVDGDVFRSSRACPRAIASPTRCHPGGGRREDLFTPQTARIHAGNVTTAGATRRIWDKLGRLIADPAAFGEDPLRDIAGYGLVGTVDALERREAAAAGPQGAKP